MAVEFEYKGKKGDTPYSVACKQYVSDDLRG